MKKRPIIARITIWYTIFLAGIALALVTALMQAQTARQKDVAKREISEILADVTEKMSVDGEDYIYDRKIEYYQKATYVSIYSSDGELIVGRRPASVAEFPDFSEGTLLRIRDTGGSEWYVYDRLYQAGEEDLWVRGMMKHTASRDAGTFILRFLLIALPAFILVAALGGRAITRGAFRPLRDIIHTTNEIRADADVSRRVPAGENRDELHELTESINGMFARIEDVLVREKQFTSDVSHELRTPLAVIQSQSEYALEDPSYSQKALETIHGTARQMSQLLNRLLLLSRSDAGTLTPALEIVDFSELLTALAEQQTFAAAEEQMELATDIPSGIRVIADEEMLARIILNLISNAIRYGKTPAPSNSGCAGTIRISLRAETGFAACTVSDSGPGISPEDQGKIWERFYQADPSRSGSGSGASAGLGLSIVQALTKAMGGTASVKSSPGSGAAFTIKVPLAQEPSESDSARFSP